jgi:hypothetical protein
VLPPRRLPSLGKGQNRTPVAPSSFSPSHIGLLWPESARSRSSSELPAMAMSLVHSELSHPVFKAKTRCSSYVCPGSSCHRYGQNVSTEYQCLYYNISYYKNLLQVQKGLNSGMNPILPQAVDRGFRTPRRNLHQSTPNPLSSRTQQQHAKSMASVST